MADRDHKVTIIYGAKGKPSETEWMTAQQAMNCEKLIGKRGIVAVTVVLPKR